MYMHTEPAWAILFPGLGSQYVGMGRELAKCSDAAAQTFAEADEIMGFHLSRLCFEGPEDKLNEIANVLPALLTVSIAAWRTLMALSISSIPTAVVGHSLGEFSALVAAGSLSFTEALYLVREQGLLAQRLANDMDSDMVAIMAANLTDIQTDLERINTATGCVIEIASDNCPEQLVLGGHVRALGYIQEVYATKVAFCQVLKARAPLHTSLMESVAQDWKAALEKVQINKPTVPVVGNVRADWLCSATQVREELRDQLTHRIRWTDSVCKVRADMHVSAMVEIGPGKILKRLVRRIDNSIRCVSFGDNLQDVIDVTKLFGGS